MIDWTRYWLGGAEIECGRRAQEFVMTKITPDLDHRLTAVFRSEVSKLIDVGKFSPDPREFLRRNLLGFNVIDHFRSIKIMTDVPRFNHDCDRCEFYGCVDYCDLWYCKNAAPFPTMIIRRSSDPADYSSSARSYAPPEIQSAWAIKDALTKITI